MKAIYLVLVSILFLGCGTDSENDQGESLLNANTASLVELSDEEYPDNPDISIRHEKYVETEMETIEFIENGDVFDLIIVPSSAGDDTVRMNGIHLMEFIPTIPECAKNDEYMALISVVNQEWNRNQVKWVGEELMTVIPQEYTVNGEKITRIDLARNCLNSYLWELFFYADVDGKDKVFYHGWFDFPKELYKTLFEKRNGESFDQYAEYMEDWKDPHNEALHLDLIREVEYEESVPFVNHDDEMYPMKGERKKKAIDIVYPVTYSKMSDFHTDSSLFATFSQPGFYNRSDPRKTELGRLQNLEDVTYRRTSTSDGWNYNELWFTFTRDNGEETQFVFGGINFSYLPVLSVEDANSGAAFSMGIGNHPFYEDCVTHEEVCSKNNPYFGVLLDAEGNWLDSHTIGIDGPLIHIDADNPAIIHVWILSFERQALVGHYAIDLSSVYTSWSGYGRQDVLHYYGGGSGSRDFTSDGGEEIRSDIELR
ncbi:MAG: hypothetical protein QNK23_15625 [Crocinitomicaceae bacterium]|nr:hypothetical protein [Crocinitomicaceae bacterium]